MEIRDVRGKDESLVLSTAHPFCKDKEKKLMLGYSDIKGSSVGDSWKVEGCCRNPWNHVYEVKATVLVQREDFATLLIEESGMKDNRSYNKNGSMRYYF